MKLVFAAGLIAAAADDQAWEAFKNQFGRTYNSGIEEIQRKAIFEANLALIEEFNGQGFKFSVGVNQFADLTTEEWNSMYKGAIPPPAKDGLPYLGRVQETESLADSMDWTTLGAVTPVKDQGQCGSCWSFSATGAMEGSYQVASSHLVSLAEQQLVDCDTATGNEGCNGGWPYLSMTYASINGACKESSYPYRAADGTCTQSSCSLALQPGTVTGYMDVSQTTAGLMSALQHGPVSITIDASSWAFQLYSTGVMDTACRNQIDHAVLATGYDTDSDGTPFWRVKNSWGTTWGDAGYFNLARGVGSQGALCVLQYPPSTATISATVSV